MKSIPKLTFSLPEWTTEDLAPLSKASERLSGLATGAGLSSNSLKIACRMLKEKAASGDRDGLVESINSPVTVRALLQELNYNDHIFEMIGVDSTILQRIKRIRSPLSILALQSLIRLFFDRFDELGSDEDFNSVSLFIRSELRNRTFKNSKNTSGIAKYATNSDILFYLDGPAKVVAEAKSNDIDLDGLVARFGLHSHDDSRFVLLCKYQYYLETLKHLPPGESHEVLKELSKKTVFNSQYSDEKQLGHKVLELLIDRTDGSNMSDVWQELVLTIAGDPRVPSTAEKYQRWWRVLGEERIARMRGFLSRLDLKLFLKVLEQSANDSGNEQMLRMYPERKVFMQGLLEENLVTDSRLFLTKNAENYLHTHYRTDELPQYARLSGGHGASVIYLELGGTNGLHMVEGSHIFKLKLMNKLPQDFSLRNPSTNVFIGSDVRSSIYSTYVKEYGDDSGILEITHHPPLSWQNKAIKFLAKNHLVFKDSSLITESSFRSYRSKYGVRT